MEKPHLERLVYSCCQLVTEVGKFIKAQLGNVQAEAIETKSRNSLVSFVDKTAEERLVSGLKSRLDGAAFLTEEGTVEAEEGEYQWIIDPLDGTTNFLHGIPIFSISLALRHNDEIIMAIIYEVNKQECFHAIKGGGAFLNNKPITVSQNPNFSDALIATGFPYYDFDHIDGYLKSLKYLITETRGVRRLGSAAVDLAYVACGRFDSFFEYSLSPWDVAAGILLVKEAGGQINDFKGGEDYLFGKSILASSSHVHDNMLRLIKENFA